MATKITVVMSNQAKREQLQKKRKKKTNTKFSVSFPFHKGAMLLKRTSFNQDNVLEVSSPLSGLDQMSSPGDRELKRDAAYFENVNAEVSSNLETSQLEQDLCEGDVDSGEFVPKTDIKVTVFQDAEGRDGVHFTQSDKETDTEEEHGGRTYGRQQGAQSLFNDWQNEDVQAEREGLFPAVSHDEAWCPYSSNYRQEEGSSDGWYSSASVQRRDNGSRQNSENDTTPPAVQQYHHQSPQMLWNHSGSGSMWTHQDLPVDVASIIEAARTNVETHSAHSGSVSSQHGVSFHEPEPRQTPFNSYYTDPHSYMTHSAARQAGYVDQRVNSQNTGPSTNPDPYGTYPASSGHSWGAWMPPNAFIQPAQAVYYEASSEVYFRTWGPN